MKKIGMFIVYCFMLFQMSVSVNAQTSPVAADKIEWQSYSDEVFSTAKKNKQFVLLFFQSEWCQWCQKTKNTTFQDKSVIQIVNRHFVPVMVDVDKNADIFAAYKISDLPSIFVLNSSRESVKELFGYIAPLPMLEALTQTVNGETTQKAKPASESPESGKSFIDVIKGLFH